MIYRTKNGDIKISNPITFLRQFDCLYFRPKNNGDIIGKGIAFLSNGGEFCHAAYYDSDGYIWESHIDTGVVRRKLNEAEFDLIVIRRLNFEINGFDRPLIEDSFNKKVCSKYDLLAFPGTFIRASIAPFFGWKNFSKTKQVLELRDGWYCSELGECTFESRHIRLVPNLNAHCVTPSDQSKSRLFK